VEGFRVYGKTVNGTKVDGFRALRFRACGWYPGYRPFFGLVLQKRTIYLSCWAIVFSLDLDQVFLRILLTIFGNW
jgi:hypothetical protein